MKSGLLSFLGFSKDAQDLETVKPDRSVPVYSYNLIDVIKLKHQKLLSTFEDINSNVDNGNIFKAFISLNSFRDQFLDQVVKEKTILHKQIRHHFDDHATSHVLSLFKNELDQTHRGVTGFLGHWKATTIEANTANFCSELQRIEQLIINRMSNAEESLYPIHASIPTKSFVLNSSTVLATAD